MSDTYDDNLARPIQESFKTKEFSEMSRVLTTDDTGQQMDRGVAANNPSTELTDSQKEQAKFGFGAESFIAQMANHQVDGSLNDRRKQKELEQARLHKVAQHSALLNSLDNIIASLDRQIADVEYKIEEVDLKIENAETRRAEIVEDIETTEVELEEVTDEISDLEEEREVVVEDVNEHETALTEESEEYLRVAMETRDAILETQKAERELEQAERMDQRAAVALMAAETPEELQRAVQDSNDAKADMKAAQRDISSSESRQQALEEDLSDQAEVLQAREEQLYGTKVELNHIDTRLGMLGERQTQLRGKLDGLQNDLELTDAEIADLKEQRADLQKELDGLKAERENIVEFRARVEQDPNLTINDYRDSLNEEAQVAFDAKLNLQDDTAWGKIKSFFGIKDEVLPQSPVTFDRETNESTDPLVRAGIKDNFEDARSPILPQDPSTDLENTSSPTTLKPSDPAPAYTHS